MSAFDKREDDFERKFAHDKELEFKVLSRRNKLLGLWAADLLGYTGDQATEYAFSVVKSELEEEGSEDVFRKVRGDFDEAGVEQSDHQIRRQMDELLVKAKSQVMNES